MIVPKSRIIVGVGVGISLLAIIIGLSIGLTQNSISNKDNKLIQVKTIRLLTCLDIEIEIEDAISTNTCIPASDSAVYLDYSYIKNTDSSGSVTFDVNPNVTYMLHVINRANGYGYEANQLLDNSKIYLTASYKEPIFAFINGLDDDVLYYPLNYDWKQFSVYFDYKANDSKIKIHQIRAIQLSNSLAPGTVFNILSSFLLNEDNSTISINTTNLLTSIIYSSSFRLHGALKFEFLVDLVLNDGSNYYHSSLVSVLLTQFVVNGQISLNKSVSNFDYSQTSLTISSATNSYLVFDVQLNKNGSFNTTKLPIGTYFFQSSIVVDDVLHISSGNILLSSNVYLNIKLLTINETISGVKSYTYQPLIKRMIKSNLLNITIEKRIQTASNKESITVNSGEKGVIFSDTKELKIKKGTTNIRLSYSISSSEYPFFVKSQSIYNDLWSLSVYASNQILFTENKDVNSMLFSEPKWLDVGRTEKITKEIDLTKLTKPNEDVSIFLKATSVNVADSLLATMVTASIETNDFVIKSVEFEKKVICTSINFPKPCFKAQNVFSIPSLKKKNVQEKYLDVIYETNSEVKIEKVEIYFVPTASSPILIRQSKIDDNNVKKESEFSLKVKAHFTEPNTISFNMFDKFYIKIILFYTTPEDTIMKEAEKLSPLITALWEGPLYSITSKRYSEREENKGGDSWSSKSMYEWLNNNDGIKWIRYNDVSGEHSLNLEHSSHELGNHVDIFHYHVLNSGSGTANFDAFVNAVKTNDTKSVKAWIDAHRSKFDLLQADSNVIKVYTHRGNKDQVKNLVVNWIKDLLEKGKTVDMDLKLDKWNSPSKINYVADHTHHIHIQIQ